MGRIVQTKTAIVNPNLALLREAVQIAAGVHEGLVRVCGVKRTLSKRRGSQVSSRETSRCAERGDMCNTARTR